jgi:nucleobase:cation symporter-1, NCS1 family
LNTDIANAQFREISLFYFFIFLFYFILFCSCAPWASVSQTGLHLGFNTSVICLFVRDLSCTREADRRASATSRRGQKEALAVLVKHMGMLGWTVGKAGGVGSVARQGSTVHGSEKTRLILRFLMLGAANCATFVRNAADFQRYVRNPFDVVPGNLVGFPIANFIVALVGNLVCASSQVIYGKLICNPVTLLDMIQTENYTAANRAGYFFITLKFAYYAILSSIFENSLPAGNDLAALFLNFITVKRGFFIYAVTSYAINPWYLLGSVSIFVCFLASYQIFLSAITGVLLCNYYLIGRGYLHMPDCLTANKSGVYHYTTGWNLRVYVAYIIGIALNV